MNLVNNNIVIYFIVPFHLITFKQFKVSNDPLIIRNNLQKYE